MVANACVRCKSFTFDSLSSPFLFIIRFSIVNWNRDVTGKPIVVCENIDAPLLGCAILASVSIGIFPSVDEAVKSMVRTARRVEPNHDSFVVYSKIFEQAYMKLSSAMRPLSHALFHLRGGHAGQNLHNEGQTIISPSLLACDWSNIKIEIDRCIQAQVHRLHVDVFDGVFLDSPYALTFGPKMVQAIRSVSQDLIIDIHLCVDRPKRYVEALATSGANRIIFQWEAMDGESMTKLEQAHEFLNVIKMHGLICGVSINPETSINEILPLLESGKIDTIDFLAVQPGSFTYQRGVSFIISYSHLGFEF